MSSSDASSVPPATPPQPPAAAPSQGRWKWIATGVGGALIVAVVGFVLLQPDDAGASEIVLEPIGFTGENPFTASVGEGQEVAPAELPATTADAVLVSGDTAGLYGGTQDSATCDAAQLVAFLQQNPDKAAAWASVPGISAADIPTYVAGLTPLLLRSDTAVTNHGFKDGKATSLQSILQAGTAVMVDDKGAPVVKCNCGNPLLEPELTSGDRTFTGTAWAGFDEQKIAVIKGSPTPIAKMKVFDVATNRLFDVAPGSPAATSPSTAPTTPTTTPGTTTTAPQATTTTTTTTQAAAPNGRYNIVGRITKCEKYAGATCATGQITGTLDVTCSTRTCTVITPSATRQYSFDARYGLLTFMGEGDPFDCGDGAPVPSRLDIWIRVQADGSLTLNQTTTSLDAREACPKGQQVVLEGTATRDPGP